MKLTIEKITEDVRIRVQVWYESSKKPIELLVTEEMIDGFVAMLKAATKADKCKVSFEL